MSLAKPQALSQLSDGQPIGFTASAKNRLQSLDAEIDKALSLPDVERQTQLRNLTEEFKLQKRPRSQIDAVEIREIPTLIAQSQHRRDR